MPELPDVEIFRHRPSACIALEALSEDLNVGQRQRAWVGVAFVPASAAKAPWEFAVSDEI